MANEFVTRGEFAAFRDEMRAETKVMIDQAIEPIGARFDAMMRNMETATKAVLQVAESTENHHERLQADMRTLTETIRAHDTAIRRMVSYERAAGAVVSLAGMLPIGKALDGFLRMLGAFFGLGITVVISWWVFVFVIVR